MFKIGIKRGEVMLHHLVEQWKKTSNNQLRYRETLICLMKVFQHSNSMCKIIYLLTHFNPIVLHFHLKEITFSVDSCFSYSFFDNYLLNSCSPNVIFVLNAGLLI